MFIFVKKYVTDCCFCMSVSASKRIMGAANVPLVPGYHGKEQDIDLMKSEAEKIGYPILIKPTHGGGGKVCRLLAYPSILNVIIPIVWIWRS